MSRRFLVTSAAVVAAGTALLAAGVARAGATPHTAAATTQRCERRQLTLAPPTSNGALGSVGLRFTFTNRSATACHLFGFPGIRLRHRDGRPLATTVIRGTSVVVPHEPERTVTLAPGGRASFFAGYSDVPTGNQRCPSSSLAQVWAPNDFRSITVPMRATACGGVITVSPVVPGRPQP
jgi:ABC-type Fe3+-hydroxamate transport system substrate-binding protein